MRHVEFERFKVWSWNVKFFRNRKQTQESQKRYHILSSKDFAALTRTTLIIIAMPLSCPCQWTVDRRPRHESEARSHLDHPIPHGGWLLS